MLTNAYLAGIVGAMPRITQRPKLILTEEEEQQLKRLSLSRTAPQREVQRSRILLYYHERRNIKAIAGLTHTTRRIVYKCVDKALEAIIRVILDNHSSHISKETRAYLATRPNRFSYVHTPKHGSWLNLVETLFGKMARTFLRGIRVETWEELKERIQKGVAEINSAPVVHRWKKFDLAQKLAG